MTTSFVVNLVLLAIIVFLPEGSGCGVQKIQPPPNITVNDGDTYPGQWPWHAAIYHRSGRRSVTFKCGGTLISTKFVLTVGVCVSDDDRRQIVEEDRLMVRLGVYNLNGPNLNTGQLRRVTKVHTPTHRVPKLQFIAALLELHAKARLDDYVQPACVYNIQDPFGYPRRVGTIVGWGQTRDEHAAVLKSIQIKAENVVTCYDQSVVYNPSSGNFLFCSGSRNGTDVCDEDRGSGYYVQLGGVWYVAGILSYTPFVVLAETCRTESYVGLTIVYDFIRWISGVTKLTHLLEKIVTREGQKPDDPKQRARNILPRHCGSFISNRIVRGQNAPLFAYPWMALLARLNPQTDETQFFCAGTLIHKRYILTAQRCCDYNEPPQFVRLGEYNVGQDVDCNSNDESDCAPPVRDYDVQRIVINTNYTDTCNRDNVALIRLKTDVVFEEHIQPICLPVTPELRRRRLDQYIVTGWGSRDPLSRLHLKTLTLQQATLPASRLAECDGTYVNYRDWLEPGDGSRAVDWLPNSTIVATCRGDDGGPLGYPVGVSHYHGRDVIRFVQFGVAAYALGGCTGGPSVYINVSRSVDWIIANVEE